MARNKAPPFLDLDRQQLEQMLERAEKAMPSDDFVPGPAKFRSSVGQMLGRTAVLGAHF